MRDRKQKRWFDSTLWVLGIVLALLVVPRFCLATGQVIEQDLTWFQFDYDIEDSKGYVSQNVDSRKPILIAQPKLTGGHYLSVVSFTVPALDWYVIDFSGSTLIGQFHHQILDSEGKDVAVFSGGILDSTPNPIMLRHGRKLILQPGDYQLLTQQQSQFNIATPTPFVMLEVDYLADIKRGNAITLIGLGILAGLGMLYLTLGLYRLRKTDLAYAVFILGNLLFNATSLLVFSDLFGVHWFTGASLPICISNMAYVFFVMRLLGIQSHNKPLLYKSGHAIIGLYAIVLLVGLLEPNWQMEMNRVGVGVFLGFGVICGISQLRSGVGIAKFYLLANLGFVLLGSIAISNNGLEGQPTLYMSHVGLLGVTIEVVLLSFVLAYQMHLTGREKASAVKAAQQSLALAQTDELTQLENRRAMDTALCEADESVGFAYLDLDGLKQCNDLKGHSFGDQLLTKFSRVLTQELKGEGRLFRIGGDEFGLLFDAQSTGVVKAAIYSTEQRLKKELYQPFGISFGIALREDYSSVYRMVEVADQRMYKHKTTRRVARTRTAHLPSEENTSSGTNAAS
ncbi:GGDEF domain-containing protein [Vibrio ulleungensis]|uniref:diguanylate cyclase n=1 Tax=Vibrio ulleungensis TaxID=2807619 RepID=A0ABS2HMV1_9VIBR|nr:diguanylate cyclase [Vibrio ulleungensis]MBM7038374.1 diguanylate cyclase [Vibrio ulleungensis]